MSDLETPDADRPGIDRRSLIKRAAVAGAAAWTAPVILGSVASPAAALTCNGTCFRVTFPSDNAGNCTNPSVAVAGVCPTGTVGANCATTTDLPAGTSYSSVCITPPGFCASTSNIFTFTLDANSPTCFTAGTCPNARRFLAARAQFTPSNACQNATINAAGTTAQFAGRPEGQSWLNFTFVIGCGCA